MTKILIKRLSKEISLPKYETNGSSGMDLAANIVDDINIDPGKTAIIPTGLALSKKEVYVYSIVPFLVFRSLEQIRNNICHTKLDTI